MIIDDKIVWEFLKYWLNHVDNTSLDVQHDIYILIHFYRQKIWLNRLQLFSYTKLLLIYLY